MNRPIDEETRAIKSQPADRFVDGTSDAPEIQRIRGKVPSLRVNLGLVDGEQSSQGETGGSGIDKKGDLCYPKVRPRLEEEEGSRFKLGQKPTREEVERRLIEVFRDIAGLPRDQMLAMLNEFRYQADKAEKDAELDLPPLPDPDPSGKSYALFVPRTDALAHLEEHWGIWLKRFNPKLDRDYLFQDDLGARDRRLLEAVRSKIKYLNTKSGISSSTRDYISPRKTRNDHKIDALPRDVRENLVKLSAAVLQRK